MLHVTVRPPEIATANADKIFFLHAAGYTGNMWGDIVSQCADMHCFIPDLSGHGHSLATPFTSFEDAADQLAELIEHTCPGEPVNIAGLSLGSYIGFFLLRRHPHLVRRAMLSGFHVSPIESTFLMRLMGDVLSPLAVTDRFQKKAALSFGVPENRLADLLGPKPRSTAKNMRAVNRSALALIIPPDLEQLDTPLLAIAGQREQGAILKSLGILKSAMPVCESRIVSGSGHGWPVVNPGLFVDTMRAWLADRPLPEELLSL